MTIANKLTLHPDRLLGAEPAALAVARRLYQRVKNLPILSPHGHTDPAWFAADEPLGDAASVLIVPDHYLFRMLYSQGVSLESLGVQRKDGKPVEKDGRAIWRVFAAQYPLFRGTPSRMWLDHVFHDVFGMRSRLSPETADEYYDKITQDLQRAEFRPRALLDRFQVEVIATTEGAVDPLSHHAAIAGTPWARRVITTFRPDDVVDPDRAGFMENLERLGELTGEDVGTWSGYLQALRVRRDVFRAHGATATDHGHPSARTADLDRSSARALYEKIRAGSASAEERELFRGQMLTEFAGMSIEDGMTMQIHAGSWRNHNAALFAAFGPDKGADIPTRTDYVGGMKPLLDRYGNDKNLTVILFTLDESTYARELAPLAGHYPCLRIGPSWWFFDSPEGMLRIRRETIETAGFYNTAGFNDDTRAFLSIPARHDVARRIDCRFLAELVADHRLDEDEAADVAFDLAYGLAKRAYKLDDGPRAPFSLDASGAPRA